MSLPPCLVAFRGPDVARCRSGDRWDGESDDRRKQEVDESQVPDDICICYAYAEVWRSSERIDDFRAKLLADSFP
jgi:hypothetical protein